MSLIESMANIAIGYCVSLIANATVLPAFGFHITASQNLSIGAIYTVISLLRSYGVRRLFNQLHMHSMGDI